MERYENVYTLEKLLLIHGSIPIVMGATDIWASIDYIDDGFAYATDQFDNYIEIDLSKDYFQLTN